MFDQEATVTELPLATRPTNGHTPEPEGSPGDAAKRVDVEAIAPLAHDDRVNAKSDADVFPQVLADVVEALDGIRFCVLGGIASASYGRPRLTKDIDVFVRREDADTVLAGLAARGFEVERTNPTWIYKGFRDGVLVDVIFKVKSDVYFDEGMAQRMRYMEYAGVRIPVVSPEDLLVTKAIATDEEMPYHWYDALNVLAVTELDWDYVCERARKSPNRVLSLLHYAQSLDLPVPARAIRSLHELIASRWE